MSRDLGADLAVALLTQDYERWAPMPDGSAAQRSWNAEEDSPMTYGDNLDAERCDVCEDEPHTTSRREASMPVFLLCEKCAADWDRDVAKGQIAPA